MSGLIRFFAVNAETIIALCALVVSVVSILIAYLTLQSQNRHSRLSVKPIGKIGLKTDPGYLQVYLSNFGTGPLLCERLRIYKSKDDIRHNFDGLLPISPEQERFISLDWASRTNFAIPAGEIFVLLEVKSKEQYSKEGKAVCDFIREALNQISLEFEYRDIYEQVIAVKTRNVW